MLDLGSTEFILAVPSLPEAELKKLSTSLFDTWEGFVDSALSLPDYSLFLQIEEGSVRGAARIGAVAAALYMGISNYGGFIAGMDTIGKQVGATSDFLSDQARVLFNCPDAKASSRKRGGAIASIQSLFVRVQSGVLSPEEATLLAEGLLGDEQNDAPQLLHGIAEALRDCPRHHKQQEFTFPEPVDELTLHQADRAPKPREPRPRPEIGPALQLRIEVWRDSKNKRRHTRVVKL